MELNVGYLVCEFIREELYVSFDFFRYYRVSLYVFDNVFMFLVLCIIVKFT